MSNSEEVTLADPLEHVHIARADSVSDQIDPRITPEEAADEEQLDESYFRQASDYIHHREHPKHSEHLSEDEKDGPLYVCLMTEHDALSLSTDLGSRLSLRRVIRGIHSITLQHENG